MENKLEWKENKWSQRLFWVGLLLFLSGVIIMFFAFNEETLMLNKKDGLILFGGLILSGIITMLIGKGLSTERKYVDDFIVRIKRLDKDAKTLEELYGLDNYIVTQACNGNYIRFGNQHQKKEINYVLTSINAKIEMLEKHTNNKHL